MLNPDERSKHSHKGTLGDGKNLLLSHHAVQRHHQKHVLHLSKFICAHLWPYHHHSFTDTVDFKHWKFFFVVVVFGKCLKWSVSCSQKNPNIGYKILMSGYQSKVANLAGLKKESEVPLVVNLFQSVLDGFIRGAHSCFMCWFYENMHFPHVFWQMRSLSFPEMLHLLSNYTYIYKKYYKYVLLCFTDILLHILLQIFSP